ncbi:MAG: helix-turn-helix transcriptional regulator, partial [Pseudonocardiaceae bacterium]
MRRRDELRDFLRTRRARLSPGDVGLPAVGRRRTPGLRREEVAVLAGVGVSWYTWLEQGRDIKVSEQVLDAIARTLQLDRHERGYLYRLAGLNPPSADAASVGINLELQWVLDGWLPRPAHILDRHWGFAATNVAAREMFGLSARDHNCLVSFFTDIRYRATCADWENAASLMIAQFRAESARHPDDAEYERLAGDLSMVSEEFARLWARHDVAEVSQGAKVFIHPHVGKLIFEYTSLPLPEHPGYRVILHNPT